MGGKGKLELILYQHRSEMSFRAEYVTSNPRNALEEPSFQKVDDLNLSLLSHSYALKQRALTSLVVVEIMSLVSNASNPGLLQATMSMKLLNKIWYKSRNVRCKC